MDCLNAHGAESISREILVNSSMPSTLKLSDVIEILGEGSRKVNNGGLALEDPHGFQSTAERRLIGFFGKDGFPVFTKLTTIGI